MTTDIAALTKKEYKFGFVTDIESDTLPPGLNEDVITHISRKKEEPQWLLDWRLKAYRNWLKMAEPTWPHVHYPPIDYQAIVYYSFVALWVFILFVVGDMIITSHRVKKLAREKFGDRIEKGLGWYAAMRTIQMRFMRLPKPQVKRGGYPV